VAEKRGGTCLSNCNRAVSCYVAHVMYSILAQMMYICMQVKQPHHGIQSLLTGFRPCIWDTRNLRLLQLQRLEQTEQAA